KNCVHDFIGEIRRCLTEKGYARSDAAAEKLKEFRERWQTLLEKDEHTRNNIDQLKDGFSKVFEGMKQDKDLQRIKSAHLRFNNDLSEGLIEAGKEAETGLQAAMEQVTWFWQDFFRFYLPRVLNKMKGIPIPRIEYKDSDIEFVCENLDVSSFHVLPSHVYIRNITDVDINTSADPFEMPRTAVGALT
ncbi:DUF5923 family protein, partial [Alcanivorax sp. MM125-6]|nr:DUF5923 family protein [Alcanivorax sp. MM125-6]